MEDTVAQGKQEREQQGECEVELSYGGEVDLHKHLKGCEKNPGHSNFVPIEKFNINHLPAGCRDEDLVSLVKAKALLTVRVSVKCVSEDRPKTFPESDKTYPCYRSRGKGILRVGTGWVWDVEKYPNSDKSYTNCECQECQSSPTPKTEFAHIRLVTASHVVFDDQEGAQTTCHLFFDSGSSPDSCISAVALTGMSYVLSNIERDCCEMTYVTHDLELADLLSKLVNEWNCIERKCGYKYSQLKKQTSPAMKDKLTNACQTLTIIVSHPHGCSKQVSFGHYIDKDDQDGSWSKYTYTTPTCPGSSGAKVWLTGWGEYGFLYYIRTHCGNCYDNKKLNYCSTSYPSRRQ